MDEIERITRVKDEDYNLISILYHSLKSAATCVQYISDAQQTGDGELVAFFRTVQEEDLQRADIAKRLLFGRLAGRRRTPRPIVEPPQQNPS